MLDAEISELKRGLPELELRENEPMDRHTSFHTGGPARVMLLPGSAEELEAAVRAVIGLGAKHFIMGNGSNLLFPDDGYDGIVIKTTGVQDTASVGGGVIRAGCGALLSRTAAFAQKGSLAGMEFAHGIPGSLGGAVIMNAGAYGGEMADIVRRVTYLDAYGERREAGRGELGFAYRKSRFEPGETVLFAELELAPGDGEAILRRMAELAGKRRASQPLDMPSAGSAFKRPEGAYAAALIDAAGLKGLRVGGAQVSEKHAGFIVNAGGAKSRDVLELMDRVREEVLRHSGVELEPEIRVVR